MLPIPQGLYHPENEHDNCGAGFICSLEGKRTNDIIHKALDILVKLEHRGAVSADGKTGDGAGILIDIPHDYLSEVCSFRVPEPQTYALGMVFLPQKLNQRTHCIEVFEEELSRQSLSIIGWRDVPTNIDVVGKIAKQTLPNIKQVFVKDATGILTEDQLNTKAFIARKRAENRVYGSKMSESSYFYLPSFSTRTVIYKGLLMPEDIEGFYMDLKDPRVVTRLALVHQRFSTNTFPTWDLAQPFRYMCHNGEINTYRGNVIRMKAREELFANAFFGEDMKHITPIVLPGKSDSSSMDMVVELLLHTGRSLPEVMMMLVPEAWEKHQSMEPAKKDFYAYNACIMEPWDGPASVPFTDGKYIGALLDRNGLRPSRYTVTKDGYVVMSSETGVIDIDPANVSLHGRLEPGRMFLVDMEEGRIIEDREIKGKISAKHPYGDWLKENLLPLKDVPYTGNNTPVEAEPFMKRLQAFGYTEEDIKTLITPMSAEGKEAIGSMGTDTPLAVLSNKPQLLYNYFKQLFAQVTNPPLDGIREEIVTDTSMSVGSDVNIFEITADHAKKLRIQNPIISNEDLDKIKFIEHENFNATSVSALYDVRSGNNGLERALDAMLLDVKKKVEAGSNIIILSDRGISDEKAPIPMLLACAHVHHGMMKHRLRSNFGIIIESAEPREPHHFALLFGYGASAINPYMVNEVIEHQIETGAIKGLSAENAIANFNKAIAKGLVKVMNKIGISTLHSYRGAQIFEALGLSKKFINTYFCNTATRIEGIGLKEVEHEIAKRHDFAFGEKAAGENLDLEIGGSYRWRRNGEAHMLNPASIAKLQLATNKGSFDTFEEYSSLVNDQSKQLMTLRGMFEFTDLDPIPIEEVEPWTAIVKRFKTGAMSLGSISEEAHENLAKAMNRIGGKSNSGEGGEDPRRFTRDEDGEWRNSAIKQVASGRFGVSSHYLTNAREIQIKMAQGAKPGEGGQLPGPKVNPYIASVRNSTPYVGLISPPPHHDIYSIEDLAQLIYDLKNANREARINVKLVSEVGVGTIAAGVAKAKADVILISGYDGGTGASPLTSLKHAGLPWELGIAEAQQTLVMNDLRGRIVMECDGQMKTGRDVAIACLLGAEEFGFSTAPLVASGCIMMRACHLNTCPVGIATQDPELRKNFKGKPEHVINFMHFVAEELRAIMAQLGFRTIDEMVGQSQKININSAIEHYKAQGIDLSAILYKPDVDENVPVRNMSKQDHGLDNVLDVDIVSKAQKAIISKEPQTLHFNIKNTNRSVGALLSNEISKAHGRDGLPADTLKLLFTGAAGQSFGCFATKGLHMEVTGNANDYFGKGLSGARLVAKVPEEATFKPEENVIIGNVAFYGATGGEAYINGIAGERFCVRNSGAIAVVEGVGDHGCEYMTGGEAIILGQIGRNFAAGMSGGIAYIYAEDGVFDDRNFNMEMIGLEDLSDADVTHVGELIQNHINYTGSPLAKRILDNWKTTQKHFIKVMPTDYKAALERMANEKQNA
ncbi:MAG: glutamate synthase large subunit [Bacteroidetes bacterium]|nr:glutamate synthase large subunit [Bacteroidota bacterium]MDA0889241.1 glutamate synthase large subunit [Bacteroidota bacterium]MDA1085095.1 glutamate synthase large subunit [Bacteroidota bacterium]